MSETLEDRKREARQAYDPNRSPFEVCPYKNPSYIEDWLKGWNEAEDALHAGEGDYYDEDDY